MKLAPSDSGKFTSLPLCDLASASEEKLLEFLLPISESVELLCLEFFGSGDYKSTYEGER